MAGREPRSGLVFARRRGAGVRSNGPDSKSGEWLAIPWVRIPPSPPCSPPQATPCQQPHPDLLHCPIRLTRERATVKVTVKVPRGDRRVRSSSGPCEPGQIRKEAAATGFWLRVGSPCGPSSAHPVRTQSGETDPNSNGKSGTLPFLERSRTTPHPSQAGTSFELSGHRAQVATAEFRRSHGPGARDNPPAQRHPNGALSARPLAGGPTGHGQDHSWLASLLAV